MASMRALLNLIAIVDPAIRRGDLATARSQLLRLRGVKIPRAYRAPIACLAWRADLPALGLRLLNPVVRADPSLGTEPTEREIAEYAQCLVRCGATEEAETLLDAIARPAFAETLLYRVSALFSRWDYGAALPLLTQYLRSPGTSPYQRLVGEVNLAAALVATGEHLKAEHLLRELIHRLSLRRHRLLFANALGFSAQNFALQGRWRNVEKCLAHAGETLKGAGTVDEFLIRKWIVIAGFLQKRTSTRRLAGLHRLRAEAAAGGRWETVRQCDQFESKASGHEVLLRHLYFGTPFGAFRERLLAYYGRPVCLPEQYEWALHRGEKRGPVFDLLSFSARGNHPLPATPLLLRLWLALVSDFYRPARLAALHFKLYPGQLYHPIHSPHRVHEAIHRLRAWIEESCLPFFVEERDHGYRLCALKPCAILVRLSESSGQESKLTLLLQDLRKHWAGESFSVTEVHERLKTPYRTLFRSFQELCARQKLRRSGNSRSTRYSFL